MTADNNLKKKPDNNEQQPHVKAVNIHPDPGNAALFNTLSAPEKLHRLRSSPSSKPWQSMHDEMMQPSNTQSNAC